MGKSSFKEFVEQKKIVAEDRKKSIDWEKRKKFYLDQVEMLYKDVEGFLSEFKEVTLERELEEIEEDIIGKYEVPVLHIRLYDKHAALMPAGTNMIGTPGRVDLVGYFETTRIILTGKNETRPQGATAASCSWLDDDEKLEEIKNQEPQGRDYVWKIITDPPKIRFNDLNEDNFLNSLQEILDV